MNQPVRISYGVMLLLLILVTWLGLATPLVTILFSYFALQRLAYRGNKAIGLLLFTLIVLVAGYGSGFFFHQAFQAFPKIATNAIPAIIRFAKQHNLELPFADLESLRTVVLDTVMDEFQYVGKRATALGKHLVLFVIGLVVGIGLFLRPRLELEETRRGSSNLYSLICAEIEARFALLYQSFARVMGAQLTISTINTGLTSVFVTWIGLPYAGLVIGVTFFCGLLPIIGNLISNTVIVCIAFTVTPRLGISALVFLIVLHKLEYLLNSKIVGGRIRNPMWLTLVALVVAERILGIPGLILAPVILDYIKTETCHMSFDREPSEPAWRAD